MKPITIGPLLLLVACGGNDALEARTAANATAETTAAIAAAETVATDKNPQASLHLKLARDQLQQAKELMEEEEEEREKAELLLRRATADAELALMLVRKTDAEEKAERARQQVQSLSRHQ